MSEESSPIYSSLATDDDLRPIVILFVDEMPERIARIRRALDDKDWDDLKVAAHQLKGSAGSHGFAELSPVAAELEEAIKADAPEDRVRAAAEKLFVFCRRVTSSPKP